MTRWWRGAAVGLVLAGLVLRIWTVLGRLGTFDSDEAAVGLLARGLTAGDRRAFYWGQHYAGTLEPALVALVLRVTSATGADATLAVKAVPLALSGVAAALVWRVGRRVVTEVQAQAAGLLCWVAPASYLWWSTKERGFYWASLCLGLGLLLAAVHAAEDGHRWWPWATAGLLGGLGFWTSPTVVYFALPAALWVLVGRHVDWARAWVAVPAFLGGSLPWLWHNVGRGWPSLDAPPQAGHVSYLGGVGRLLWRVLPIAVDLRIPVSERWVAPVVAPLAYLGLVALVAVAAVRRRDDRPTLVLLGAVLFPVVYGLLPVAWFVGEGRYGLFALPYLALAIAWAVRRPPLLMATCVVALGLTVHGLGRLGSEEPRRLRSDIAALRRNGVDRAWADYWLAYRLTFESDRQIIATSALAARYEPYVHEVLADASPAYLYADDDARAARFRTFLERSGLPYRELRTAHLHAFLVERPLLPTQLPEALRL